MHSSEDVICIIAVILIVATIAKCAHVDRTQRAPIIRVADELIAESRDYETHYDMEIPPSPDLGADYLRRRSVRGARVGCRLNLKGPTVVY